MLGGHLLTKIENGQRLHYYGVESQQFHTGTTMIKRNRGQNLQSDMEIGANHFFCDGVSLFCLFVPFSLAGCRPGSVTFSSPFGKAWQVE